MKLVWLIQITGWLANKKKFEDVGRVASSFPTYPGKIKVTLLAGYQLIIFKEIYGDQSGD